jgi:hypothetical protein
LLSPILGRAEFLDPPNLAFPLQGPPMTTRRLAALIATFAATLLAAPAAPHAAEGKNVLQCDGAFAKDTSHARLVQAFGKSSVAFMDIDGAEGEKVKASVVYPDESRRRVEIMWHDEKARSRPATIRVGFKSQWRTVRGLRIGSDLAEVEKINGKPFKMLGFDWDFGGRVSDWLGGALATVPGGCDFRLAFNPWADAPDPERGNVSGDKAFLSTDPNMRASKPTVSEIIISYPE